MTVRANPAQGDAGALYGTTSAPRFGAAGEFAGYRRLLRQQGKAGLEDTVTAGDEERVAATVRRFAEAGVTDLLVSPPPRPALATAGFFALEAI